MSITFNDLLTEPKYREMTYDQIHNICAGEKVEEKTLVKIRDKFDPFRIHQRASQALFNHLQKLKAESEKKAEPNNLVEKLEYTKFFSQGLSETSIETKQPPIQITDQKAREICAKYFNCNHNEIKIV